MSWQNKRKRNGIKLPLALQQELGLPDTRDTGDGHRRHGGSRFAEKRENQPDLRSERGRGGRGGRGGRAGRGGPSSIRRNFEKAEDIGFDRENSRERHSRHSDVEIKALKDKQRRKQIDDVPVSQPKSILKKTRVQPPSPEESEDDRSRSSSPGLVLDPSSSAFRQRAEEDDADIAALERKLGLKGKSKSKLGDDMLDYVLDGSDEEVEGKKRKREGQDWLDQKRRKVVTANRKTVDSDLDDDTEEDDISELGDDDELESDLDGFDDLLEDEVDGSEAADGFDGFESEEGKDGDLATPKRVRENPYVAPVVPGSTGAKYIPPSLRKRQGEDSSNLDGLRRQLQGQLNKLSEANVISILGEVEKLYRTNPRQDVTTVLIDLILTSFCVRSALQNTFIILHAAFLAAVYKVMGTDFGAELLVRLVERFDQEFKSPDQGKEAINLISLFANLFTFNVVSSHIIYDQVKVLLSDFSENNAELLLRIVRDCGPQLRSDDPAALKDIVGTLQDISAGMAKEGQTINIRTRVMMDTITDLKNNKMKNATNAAGVTGEHITRMRKALGSLNNRTLKATEPLRITREDISNSDKKGKWWLVGASWKGHEQKENEAYQSVDELPTNEQSQEEEQEVDLLALAKQYRMNTDVRRSIFVAIMSATDCRDAQTRILKLRLSTKQEQEIAKVLLRCARAEPAYNPYYALLTKNLCKENKKVRMGFQFGLWDFFRRMGENADDDDDDDEGDGSAVELHEIVNVAKLYAYLIFQNHLSLGVLKTLNVGFLKEQSTMFLEVLLISILTQPKASEETLMKVFGKAADTPQIVKGVDYFLKKNVRKSDLVSKKDRERVKDGCRIAEVAFRMIDSVETN